jgi:hypothetical protein
MSIKLTVPLSTAMPVDIGAPQVVATGPGPRRQAGPETSQLENRDVSMNNMAALAWA